MPEIFFTSDPHFGHKNIAGKNVSAWPSGYRIFKSLKEHDYAIVNGINSVVGQDDDLFCLGDWCFGGIENIWNFRKQLICKNIYLILGNHDGNIRKNRYLPNCENNTRAKDLFNSVYDYLELPITINNRLHNFVLCHYSMRIWNGSHKGYMHLYGHSHDSLEHTPNGKSMDVGVDSAYRILGKYRPFHSSEVIDILSKRNINFIDHHDINTNVK